MCIRDRGTLVHSGRARQPITPASETNQRGEEPRSRAGIPHKQLDGPFFRTATTKDSPLAMNPDRSVRRLVRREVYRNVGSKSSQTSNHNLGILTPQGVVKRGLAFCKRRQEQSTVGNTLGTGDRNLSIYGGSKR